MAIENLPLFSAMNEKPVERPCVPPFKPLTVTESHMEILQRVNSCISQVNDFEHRTNHIINGFMENTKQGNEAFKETLQTMHNTFVELVRNEINTFETTVSSTNELFKNNIEGKVNLFTQNIEKIVDNYRLQIIETCNNYKTQVEQHMNTQDEKIAEYKKYMVDNLISSLTTVFNQKVANGEIETLMSDIFGSGRTFKGSLSYEEIQEITDATNGDYYFCTTDEHYYQRSETEWIDIGNGDRLSDDYEAFKLNTSNTFTEIDNRFQGILTSVNLFDKRRATKGVYLAYDESGGTFAFADGFVSDYIEVDPDRVYHVNHTGTEKRTHFYDENKNYIDYPKAFTFVTPSNCKYIRFATLLSEFDETMVLAENWSDTYIPYKDAIRYRDIIEPPVFPHDYYGYKRLSDNLVNTSNPLVGWYLYDATGTLKEFEGYSTTDYCSIEPNTLYSAKNCEQIIVYDKNKMFLQKLTAVSSFTTHENAKYFRVSAKNAVFEKAQINEGETLLSFDEFSFTFERLNIAGNKREKICTLGYAWNKWANGEKFPIGILGDSTTDGANTTDWSSNNRHEAVDNANGSFGSVDYICATAYPYLLEQRIRKELGNDVMRVYNLGYSGYSFITLIPKYEQIFSGVYNDVKMVGISLGINDRCETGHTELSLYNSVRNNLIYTIEFLYDKGIQPFIITSQATLEPAPDAQFSNVLLRTSEAINSIVNRVKKEVANEYGLELIDMTAYGEFMMTYSNYKIADIIQDDLHFEDLGHKLEADFLFSKMCPRTVTVTNGTKLGFNSQMLKSECRSNYTTYFENPVNGFKVGMNYTKENTDDIVVQNFIVNNVEKKPVIARGYCQNVGSQYVVIDGETYEITSTTQFLTALDVGVHSIEVYSGETSTVDWLGLTFYFE